MNALSSFFKRGPQDAKASELGEALRAAEAERQALREREQTLAVARQDALLGGSDDELDAIEAELTTLQRAGERHDARIPELRRLHDERLATERAEANRRAYEQAVAQRLAIAERIDTAFAELGKLFGSLEEEAAILRQLDGYHQASRRVNGPMALINLDRDHLTGVLLHHVPTVAHSLGLEAHSARPKTTFRSVEEQVWRRLSHGHEPAPARPEPRQTTPDEAEAAEVTRRQQQRYRDVGSLSELKI